MQRELGSSTHPEGEQRPAMVTDGHMEPENRNPSRAKDANCTSVRLKSRQPKGACGVCCMALCLRKTQGKRITANRQ